METQAQFSHIYGKPQNFLAQSLLYTYIYTVELYTILCSTYYSYSYAYSIIVDLLDTLLGVNTFLGARGTLSDHFLVGYEIYVIKIPAIK